LVWRRDPTWKAGICSPLRAAERTLLAALIFGAGVSPGPAADAADVDRRERLEEEIDRLDREVGALSRTEAGVLGEIERLSALETKQALESRRYELQERAAAAALAVSRRRLGEAQEGMTLVDARLGARLRALYMAGPLEARQLLAGARTAGDAALALRHAEALAGADAALAAEAREAHWRLTGEVEAERLHERELHDARVRAETTRAALAASRGQREAALQGIRQDRTARLGALNELRRAAEALASMARDLSGAQGAATLDFGRFRGLLPWPVRGQIAAGFGPMVHPRFQTALPHDGIDIRASLGTEVRSVFEGRVAWAGWLAGYGLTVMLDHGGGWMTVYAHASALLVETGDTVPAGRAIAAVGDTGSLSGEGLYFEIRRGGKAVDPRLWLKGN